MSAKKGLGRSFDSLIPTELFDESFDPTAEQDDKVSELRQIPLTNIVVDPNQPRRTFDEVALNELSESLKNHGVLQPIVVTPQDGTYQIVAGERRYRAAKLAGLDKIPAIVRKMSDQHKLEISLIENIQRRDLNVIETATAYLKLRDQFNLTLDEIGQRVGGKSVSAVSNTLRLLRLPEEVRQALVEGKLREGQARPLISVDPAIIHDILPTMIKEEWSARKIEQFIVQLKKNVEQEHETKVASASAMPYEADAERLVERLAAKVSVKTNARGAGQIVIRFKNDDDFQRIQKILNEK